ncbi:MAG: hydrolase [Propionibacterium sp.]|nr:MAG: hydrolase [Propionibacterium sp.]
MANLIDSYDCALFDLDGVLYLGPDGIPGTAEAITGLKSAGIRLGYVTNNAARRPIEVANHLNELGIAAVESDVVSSSQAGARMVAAEFPPGSKVLIVGTEALAEEIAGVGLEPVWNSSDNPVAVIQGYDPKLAWHRIDDACYAIAAGAKWFATNLDASRPTNRGQVPGAGPQIDAVASAVGFRPPVAGKPYRPLLDETIVRMKAKKPIFVGDRIDTDIMGAVNVGMDSLFVFTGVHGKYDLAAADESGRPSHIGYGVPALLKPARTVQLTADSASCNSQQVKVIGNTVKLATTPTDLESQLDALWALLQLLWADPKRTTEAFDQLDLLP